MEHVRTLRTISITLTVFEEVSSPPAPPAALLFFSISFRNRPSTTCSAASSVFVSVRISSQSLTSFRAVCRPSNHSIPCSVGSVGFSNLPGLVLGPLSYLGAKIGLETLPPAVPKAATPPKSLVAVAPCAPSVTRVPIAARTLTGLVRA